jgi:hypothetical protein
MVEENILRTVLIVESQLKISPCSASKHTFLEGEELPCARSGMQWIKMLLRSYVHSAGIQDAMKTDVSQHAETTGYSRSVRTARHTQSTQGSVATMCANAGAYSFQVAYTRAACVNGWSFRQVDEEYTRNCFKEVTSKKLPHLKMQKQTISNEKKRLIEWIKQASEKAIEKEIGAALMTDSWTNPVSGRLHMNMLLYLPDHGFAYLGSIDAHGKKQSARCMKDWMMYGLS